MPNRRSIAACSIPIFLIGFSALSGAALAQSADGALPPVESKALFAWLKAGSYKSWVHESKSHPSAGPHPVEVIAFLNPVLDLSLKAGNKSHPVNAAAVKELYSADDKIRGWAVSVKTQAQSDGGKGWYWYEVLSPANADRTVAAAHGVPLCVGCHAPGKDYVLIPYPLK
ncbi:MAG: hypothetical protein HYU77_04490 [Betaproteobacteria bacterium]|nr:hypothetical protein [Betaproteobacteria bacterium]